MNDFILKDNFTYGLVILTIIASVTVGYLLAYQPVDKVCAEYITEYDKQKQINSELNAELTKTKAECKAKAVLTDCNQLCDERVKKALKDFKAITCED